MNTYFDCIPCFVRQAVHAIRLVTDDSKTHERVLRDVMKRISEMYLLQPPPALAHEIHRIIREASGSPDPYADLKRNLNEAALDMLPELEKLVEESSDPFETAVRLAIAGNIIDFGFTSTMEPEKVRDTIKKALEYPFPETAIAGFKAATHSAQSILYLADNAGEIVFDKLLIEQLPRGRVTVAVRGRPILNDVMLADAEQVGIHELAEVIDNGSDAPGTVLELCSEEFRERFNAADLIISKGMGNYEALNESDRPIWFLWQAKCNVVSREAGVEVGEMLIVGPSE